MKRLIRDAGALSIEDLDEIFYIVDGVLYWKRRMSIGATVGKAAGGLDGHGYVSVKLRGHTYQGHRIIWAMTHRAWPEVFLDHIDGCRSNNQTSNLREATFSQNGANRRMHKNNTSGLKGASFNRLTEKWAANICINRCPLKLGTYDSAEAAHAAYVEAAHKHFGEYARVA